MTKEVPFTTRAPHELGAVNPRDDVRLSPAWRQGVTITRKVIGVAGEEPPFWLQLRLMFHYPAGWRTRCAYVCIGGRIRLWTVEHRADEPLESGRLPKLSRPVEDALNWELGRPSTLKLIPESWVSGREPPQPGPGRPGNALSFYARWAASYVAAKEVNPRMPIAQLLEWNPDYADDRNTIDFYIRRARGLHLLTAPTGDRGGGVLTHDATALLTEDELLVERWTRGVRQTHSE